MTFPSATAVLLWCLLANIDMLTCDLQRVSLSLVPVQDLVRLDPYSHKIQVKSQDLLASRLTALLVCFFSSFLSPKVVEFHTSINLLYPVLAWHHYCPQSI